MNQAKRLFFRVLSRAKDGWPSLRQRKATQGAETLATMVRRERLAALDAKAFIWIARGREANLELGRVFIEIKRILPHGQWAPYFAEKFEPKGIALRTAELYMQMAREADDVSQSAKFANFPLATDPQAQAINDATEKAESAVAFAGGQSLAQSKSEVNKERRRTRIRLGGNYNLPIFLTGDQKDAIDELRKSENWACAESEIIGLLKHLLVKYGIVNEPEAATGTDQTRKRPDEEAEDANSLA